MSFQKQPSTKGFSGFRMLHLWGKIRSKPSLLLSFVTIVLLLLVAVGSLLTMTVSHLLVHAANNNTAVLTYKGDNGHTGNYANETILNTSNVNKTQFGQRVSYPVDGQVYAQPLYEPNLTVNGATHNTVFAATEHDSVYAFDADQTSTSAPLWHDNFVPAGATTVPSNDMSCNDLTPEVGITGTPGIDNISNTMYVVSFTKENGNYVYRLHALDVTTGLDKPGSPVVIQGSVPGVGAGSSNGSVAFNPFRERQRAALLMANGQIYIPFGSFCDNYPYHGWIFSYSYNGSAFQQTHVYNDTPNGAGGGIWGGGGAVTADSAGSIYYMSGNGNFNANNGGTEMGDAFVKLTPALQQTDYFAPFNATCLDGIDADYGSGGPLILPNTNEAIGAGKEGRIYVVNTNNMGKFTADPGLVCSNTTELKRTDIDKVLQETPPSTTGGVYDTPAYWNGPNGQYIYIAGVGSQIKAYQLTNGLLSTATASSTPQFFGFPSVNPVLSSNGSTSGSGILWVIDNKAILRAYDATNLSTELYDSSQNAARDGLDSYVKFSMPAVGNGQVFVGTRDALYVYGLAPTTPTTTPTVTVTPSPTPGVTYNNSGISDDANQSTGNFDGNGHSYSKQAIQLIGVNNGDNTFFGDTVFTWPNTVPGQQDNYVANGQTIPVTPLANATTLGFLGAAVGAPSSGIATLHYSDNATQAFTLGFSDWTLNQGVAALAFGNQKMMTLPYQNSATGSVNVNTYVFYANVPLQTDKTLVSVTLPATVSGGPMHIFTIATNGGAPPVHTPTPTPTATPPPNPAPAFNNSGTSDDSHPASAGLDGVSSYSAQALQGISITPGVTVSFNGVAFTWPSAPSGTANNYIVNGQVIPVTPVANAGTLAFLGASVAGPGSGTATITYTDGTTQTFTLGFSDWTRGSTGTDPLSFGNQLVATAAYRNTPTGADTIHKPSIFYVDITLQAGKIIQSVTLPSTTTGGQVHVFTLGTKGIVAPTGPAYNNIGISSDSAPTLGKFDGAKSYSAQSLQAAGIVPGSQVSFNGVSFTWPNVPAGTADNYKAAGQVIPVTPVTNATTLAFLGADANGSVSGTATITYTDGTTQTFTLGFTDWTRTYTGVGPLAFGNLIVATLPYRNSQTGIDAHKPNIFYADIALQAGKTVQSVTLPAAPAKGAIHVFSIATKGYTALPAPAYNNIATSDDANPSAGSFDGIRSYSAQALKSLGITPGSLFAYNGVTFTWPGAISGAANNYVVNGQVIPLAPVNGATTLAFLGATANGSGSGTATVTYTDGTIQTFTLGFNDWTLGANGGDPLVFGNQVAAICAYRNMPTGPDTHKPVVFYTDVALQGGKIVQSVTLPTTTTGGQVHVFAVSTK